MGPVTVAGSWGPFGALVGCRTGPSPRVDLVRRLRAERWLGECVRHAGGGGLDLAFDVAGSGEVRAVDVVEATPAAPALASCLMRATGLQFLPTGCRWQGRFFYLLLGTAPPTPPQSRSNRVVSSR